MINAKKEFLNAITNINKPLLAVSIIYGNSWDDDDNPEKKYQLKCNYTKKEYDNFLESLNFKYDNGYGGQLLRGLIYFSGFTMSRSEYDGSEWWAGGSIDNLFIPKELGEVSETWLLNKLLKESNSAEENQYLLEHIKSSTICKLLKNKGYNIEEILNWFQLLESNNYKNHLLCISFLKSENYENIYSKNTI